jgi:hypothetical protein
VVAPAFCRRFFRGESAARSVHSQPRDRHKPVIPKEVRDLLFSSISAALPTTRLLHNAVIPTGAGRFFSSLSSASASARASEVLCAIALLLRDESLFDLSVRRSLFCFVALWIAVSTATLTTQTTEGCGP